MKYAGMIILIIASTGLGFFFSEKLKKKALICGDLIKLCDVFLLDLDYRITPAKELLNKALESGEIKHLDFVSCDNLMTEKSVESALSGSENDEISRFLFSLGKSDVNSQKKLIFTFKEYIKNSMLAYREKYKKDSKIYVCFGLLFSVAFSLIWS